MDENTRKSNPPKRLPSSLIERNLKTTNLLLKIGLQTSGDMISDLFMGKSVNLNKSLFSTKNVYSTVETLKQLRGAAMKFGQLISIDDQLIFTPELSQIIGQLRSSGYSMPPRQVKKVLDKNWGPGWLKSFDSFEVQPFAAASIGQVHKAKLKNGLELAIKIQFPNIRETIKNDMRSLKFIANKASFLPQDFDLNYYFKICEEQLMVESEYILEAKNIEKYSALCKANKNLRVPTICNEFSTDQILAMSFEDGSELCSQNSIVKLKKNKIAELLIRLLLDEIFIFQFVQTDPNLSNFLLKSADHKVVLLDFGSCSNVSNETKDLYKGLLSVGLTLNRTKIKNFLNRNGFLPSKIDKNIDDFINELIDTVIEELKVGKNFNFAESKLFNLIEADKVKEFQKILPQTRFDPDFIFIQRKILGFLLFFKSINASIPILSIIKEYDKKLQNR